MAQGLQVWDGAGRTMLDTNDRITRVLGTYTIAVNQGAGELYHAGLASGSPWYSATVLGFSSTRIYIDNQKLSWTANTGSQASPIYIIYGVF